MVCRPAHPLCHAVSRCHAHPCDTVQEQREAGSVVGAPLASGGGAHGSSAPEGTSIPQQVAGQASAKPRAAPSWTRSSAESSRSSPARDSLEGMLTGVDQLMDSADVGMHQPARRSGLHHNCDSYTSQPSSSALINRLVATAPLAESELEASDDEGSGGGGGGRGMQMLIEDAAGGSPPLSQAPLATLFSRDMDLITAQAKQLFNSTDDGDKDAAEGGWGGGSSARGAMSLDHVSMRAVSDSSTSAPASDTSGLAPTYGLAPARGASSSALQAQVKRSPLECHADTEFDEYQGAPLPDTEDDRMHHLCQLNLLDTDPEERYNAITELVSEIFSVRFPHRMQTETCAPCHSSSRA